MQNFLKLKNRSDQLPSDEDLKLILFSKHKKAPLISNDYDITFFAEELLENSLAYNIYEFKSINIIIKANLGFSIIYYTKNCDYYGIT